ncbi:uncharacterized protein MELLADRAFT_86004 [Melampsora larici-populina 98AG31]|uniref:Uncharacterized protein n=1 Tax=Melampsora larici-populina (strain 98AG31 / pathotype 3-4-7) TaxID=747676 RepID=F4RKF6_MELLP|nr:uncharacterized protein MELLADRAFT_86004 [Melampsora larici-populina 98AG31]EGG07088.1 hypothetical protein MELLADRAFT_86004 [Melampsora larici-populina 98AG31]
MSDEDSVTGHGIYLSSNFEIEEKITPEQPQRETQYRTYVLSIPCSGADRDRCFTYEIRATGFSGKNLKLIPKNIYHLRGAFFPRNLLDTSGDQLFFEASDRGVITNGKSFPYSLIDNVGITGLGRISKITTTVETSIQHMIPKNPNKDKVTTIVTVEHSDYHPESKSAKVVKEGRECLFHGYIKDLNEITNCYVVIVSRVSPTSGHVEPSEMTTEPGIKARPADTKGNQNPNKPVNIPFGPSDFAETSFSSASSRSQTSSSKDKVQDEDIEEEYSVPAKKTKTRAPPKPTGAPASQPAKRPRAPRARRGAGPEKVLDIALDD